MLAGVGLERRLGHREHPGQGELLGAPVPTLKGDRDRGTGDVPDELHGASAWRTWRSARSITSRTQRMISELIEDWLRSACAENLS
jgi:hypothetical protein